MGGALLVSGADAASSLRRAADPPGSSARPGLAAAAPAGETEDAHPCPSLRHLGGAELRRKLPVRRGAASCHDEAPAPGSYGLDRRADNRIRSPASAAPPAIATTRRSPSPEP